MRTSRLLRRLAPICGLLVLGMAGPAAAQDAPADFFNKPVLILAGGGHHAPVRSIVFSRRDGSQLLTGGMDKVIHVWNPDADGFRPAQTLRPPNWRAFRGQVNALALSPAVAGGNPRVLAVAGYGIRGDLGEILLFQYPDPTGQGTGVVVGQLSATATPETGHSDVVTSLAFTPDGRFLASASNDRTVRIWDVAARRTVSVLSEATLPINILAIFADGTRLVAGGRDGVLRLYDIADRARPRLIHSAPPDLANPRDPFSGTITAMAVSPDGRWIVVGTEGGLLIRRDAASLAGQFLENSPIPRVKAGPVEAVAIHPDGDRMAVSVIPRNQAGPADPPTVGCYVEIRAVADGRLLERVDRLPNLVYALAFSPDGERLAYSGGDSQSIFLKRMTANAPPPEEIPGQGSSLWDVGFRVDGLAIRFSRAAPAEPVGAARAELVVPGRAAVYEAFHLRGRFLYDPEPDEPAYRHAVATEAGWTIRPAGVTQIDFVSDRGQVHHAPLDPDNERRWFCYTVIPPNPAAGHADPVAAVGCQAGVLLWNLATGERTRFFAGHAGPVYSVASSPDGKWLLTGSADQTVRLWPLAGSDRPPPFGARFAPRPGGGWLVAEVTPGGFADGLDLKPGQVVKKFFIGREEQSPGQTAELLPRLDALPAITVISFHARTEGGAQAVKGVTTKKDSAALSIFPSLGREWVIWTPRGHYDTSIAGDRKYLGWLTNRAVDQDVGRLLSGQFDTIDKFEARFRQPMGPVLNALDTLLDTGDPIQAAAAAPAVAPEVAGPRTSGGEVTAVPLLRPSALALSTVTGGPVVALLPQIPVRITGTAATDAARIARITVSVDGRTVATRIDGEAVAAFREDISVPLGPSQRQEVAVHSEDMLGVVRKTHFSVTRQAPPDPTRRPSRLEILAIGAENYRVLGLPPIRHAAEDVEQIGKVFQERMIDPTTGKRFAPEQVKLRIFKAPDQVAVGPLTRALDDLRKATRDRRLGAGDVVAVVIESHFFSLHSRPLFATAEADDDPANASISATDLAERLGELSRAGCRVFVLVDAVHEVNRPDWDNNIKEWVRHLQTRGNVVAFLASDQGPSWPLKGQSRTSGFRAFAEAVIDAHKIRASGRPRAIGLPMTLSDFNRSLIESVLAKTLRRQHAQVFLPDTIPFDAPFLDTAELPPAEPPRSARVSTRR